MRLRFHLSHRGNAILVNCLLILLTITTPLLQALDLKPSRNDYRSLRIEFSDPLSGLELRLTYGKYQSDDQAFLTASDIDDATRKTKVNLNGKDLSMLHGMLRNIFRDFQLEDSLELENKLDLGMTFFRVRLETPENCIELSYLPQDRPRSDAAAKCYFWLLQKLPMEWQKKVLWKDQFELWSPKSPAAGGVVSSDVRVSLSQRDDLVNRSVKVLSATRQDAYRLLEWQLDESAPLKPTRELVEVAKTRLRDYGMQPDREATYCSGIDWRRHDSGNGWYLSIFFYTSLIKDPRATLLPKDDGQIIEVPMLPDGTPIKVDTRPMNEEELRQYRLPIRLPSAPPSPDDPFAPDSSGTPAPIVK